MEHNGKVGNGKVHDYPTYKPTINATINVCRFARSSFVRSSFVATGMLTGLILLAMLVGTPRFATFLFLVSAATTDTPTDAMNDDFNEI